MSGKRREACELADIYEEEEDLEKNTILKKQGDVNFYLTHLPSDEWAVWNDAEDSMRVFRDKIKAIKFLERRI
jgi:hypothetical protein